MSFFEIVCSIMKDIMEEALTIFQKNHRPSEDSQRNHSELLKTVERAWKEQLVLGGKYNMEDVEKCMCMKGTSIPLS